VLSALGLLVKFEGMKLLLVGRVEGIPPALEREAGTAPTTKLRLGRFATVETVSNVLDDYFDRSKSGLDTYPPKLLAAVDRHPLVAVLVGKILQKAGPNVLSDEKFFPTFL
jgi:hypothetical protein